MYLARFRGKSRQYYQIKRSVAESGSARLVSQVLFHLGSNPAKFLVYPGGNAFYIREEVEEALERKGVSFDYAELEKLFWPFVDPEIRFKLDPFMERGRRKNQEKINPEVLAALHPFDKHRLHYLRCGQMEQSDLCFINDKLFSPLVGKSRDELEQYFMEMERTLRERELKGYVFTVFDLQSFFRGSRVARAMPETIEEDKMDKAFLDAYCALDRDSRFWAGLERKTGLGDYLSRYLIMFFDNQFAVRSLGDEFVRNFMNSRRRYAPPARKVHVAPQEVEELFGRPLTELQKMGRTAFARLFRKRAKMLHPDKGGSHEVFVRLTALYEELRRTKMDH